MSILTLVLGVIAAISCISTGHQAYMLRRSLDRSKMKWLGITALITIILVIVGVELESKENKLIQGFLISVIPFTGIYLLGHISVKRFLAIEVRQES